ncbi:MAG: nucleotidyl transferase AbiEii/AbiGii toxin family protein [Actinomycetota bacterium]|nr:nucleotidyl transferase AbiEii/AbiGii toxin family protein [Actinomycetota bacterium]MDK1095781.1 nucleotidyl transferase AbiEii/AbiGii toxin family protein [Actinomycetota bacterium]MDK1291394.1 nucleotidyl transferase AbiEii/AbiGii toxin family protein [Actinomycetota bacterium]
MLAAIAAAPELSETWVFKGGTCLRKCFYETYRFSEDLDFTVIEGGPETPEELAPIFEGVGDWLRDQIGVEIVVDADTFVRHKNRRGNPTTQGRIAYRGPSKPPTITRSLPSVRGHPVPNGPRIPTISPGFSAQIALVTAPTARTVRTSRSGWAGSPETEIGTSPTPKM